jgi:hypothetical protein
MLLFVNIRGRIPYRKFFFIIDAQSHIRKLYSGNVRVKM